MYNACENQFSKSDTLNIVFQTDQETTNLTSTLADELAGTDPDFSTRDLYNAIHEGNFPTWTFYIQLMPLKDAETYRYNPFDATKVGINSGVTGASGRNSTCYYECCFPGVFYSFGGE